MTKLYEVQQAIYERLINDEELNEKITGIFDAVPDESPFPYIVLGRIYSEPSDTKTSKGWRVEQILDVWSASKGKKETISIIESIKNALEEELSIDGVFVISQQLRNIEILEEVVDLFHGTVTYEILIDLEG